MSKKSKKETPVSLSGYISYILAALWLVLGLIFAVWPSVTSRVLWFIVALVLIISGCVSFILGLSKLAKQSDYPYVIELSAVLIAIGIWIFVNPTTFLSIIPILCGVLFFIHGLVDALKAWKLSKRTHPYWWSALATGGVLLVFAIILFFNPFKQVDSTLRYIGIVLILNGLADMWLCFCLSAAGRFSLLDEPAKKKRRPIRTRDDSDPDDDDLDSDDDPDLADNAGIRSAIDDLDEE
ncbi:MAG: DUF308 domain-containing protein [Clostridia bacterium]|nr:DUF308 domain-containing protein [Clostridia bacterium]NCC42660.1 DUF308 domain-containing protein [Clostridia bacterium]